MTEGRRGRGDVDMSGALARSPRKKETGGAGTGGEDPGSKLLGRRTPKRRNRKKTGKRSNPDWTLASCYVEKKVYWAAREALAIRQRELGRKVDYSELVNRLLRDWCEEQGIDVEEVSAEASEGA